MSEQDRVIELFKKNFVLKNKENTIIYGLGKMTESILLAFPQYPILGLLDGFQNKGTVFGKEIISLEKLKKDKTRIIIVARKASEKVIYKRIKDFCNQENIKVYSLDGSLLKAAGTFISDNSYFTKTKEELVQKIKSHECISFDVFDTLLVRKISDRECAFKILREKLNLQFDFARLRLEAENRLSRSGVPSIEDIYKYIAGKAEIKNAYMDQLIDEEIAFEKSLLISRQEIVQIFKQTIFHKPVYIITDMYLHKETIKEILAEHGIEGYRDIFVSCEYKTDKRCDLFKKYKEKAVYTSYLHIGDSIEADGKAAHIQHIDSYIIKNTYDMAEISEIGTAFADEKDEILKGILAADLFNSPYYLNCKKGKMDIKTPEQLGYQVMGPILLIFTKWLKRKTEEDGINQILFIARDGYLIKKIYDLLEGGAASLYLQTSRGQCILAGMESTEDIRFAADLAFNGNLKEMLIKRFGFDGEEILSIPETKEEMITEYKDSILGKSLEYRKWYQIYLKKKVTEEEVGIFDFVSTGTCHMFLEKLTGKKLKGYYFERIEENYIRKKELEIIDFIRELNTGNINYFYFEPIIKEIGPSLHHIDGAGKAVYRNMKISKSQKEFIQRIQNGVLSFVMQYKEYRFMDEPIDTALVSRLLESPIDEYIKEMKYVYVNYDEFTNRVII